jgi:hypothetical protein
MVHPGSLAQFSPGAGFSKHYSKPLLDPGKIFQPSTLEIQAY